MWPNPQFPGDLLTVTEKSLMENIFFCAVKRKRYQPKEYVFIQFYLKCLHFSSKIQFFRKSIWRLLRKSMFLFLTEQRFGCKKTPCLYGKYAFNIRFTNIEGKGSVYLHQFQFKKNSSLKLSVQNDVVALPINSNNMHENIYCTK